MILPILAVLFYTRVPIIARWIDIHTPFFALENGSFVATDGAADGWLDGAADGGDVLTGHNPATGWPDPLVTIWEPRAYPVLLQFLTQGYSCPRKVLINSDTAVIEAQNPQILLNANSPEERQEVERLLEVESESRNGN